MTTSRGDFEAFEGDLPDWRTRGLAENTVASGVHADASGTVGRRLPLFIAIPGFSKGRIPLSWHPQLLSAGLIKYARKAEFRKPHLPPQLVVSWLRRTLTVDGLRLQEAKISSQQACLMDCTASSPSLSDASTLMC